MFRDNSCLVKNIFGGSCDEFSRSQVDNTLDTSKKQGPMLGKEVEAAQKKAYAAELRKQMEAKERRLREEKEQRAYLLPTDSFKPTHSYRRCKEDRDFVQSAHTSV